MTLDWDNIKNEIKSEVKEILQAEPNFKIDEVLDLFVKVLLFPVNESYLEGVATRIPNSLQKILLENIPRIDKNNYFPDVASIEFYLRKVLYLIDYQSYLQVANSKDGLGTIIPLLGLNPNNVNFNWTTLNSHQKSNFAEHLIKSYQLRNIQSHNCKDWSNAKLYDELRSVLVMCLFATQKNFRQLKLIVEPNDLTEYLQKQSQIFLILTDLVETL